MGVRTIPLTQHSQTSVEVMSEVRVVDKDGPRLATDFERQQLEEKEKWGQEEQAAEEDRFSRSQAARAQEEDREALQRAMLTTREGISVARGSHDVLFEPAAQLRVSTLSSQLDAVRMWQGWMLCLGQAGLLRRSGIMPTSMRRLMPMQRLARLSSTKLSAEKGGTVCTHSGLPDLIGKSVHGPLHGWLHHRRAGGGQIWWGSLGAVPCPPG